MRLLTFTAGIAVAITLRALYVRWWVEGSPSWARHGVWS